MSRCEVVATEKPQVWKDEYGWRCDQSTICRTCNAVSLDTIAEDATWEQAVLLSLTARPVEDA